MSLAERQQRFIDLARVKIALAAYTGIVDKAKRDHYTAPASANSKWEHVRKISALSAAFSEEQVQAKQQAILNTLDDIQFAGVKREATAYLVQEINKLPDSALYPLLYVLDARLSDLDVHLAIGEPA